MKYAGILAGGIGQRMNQNDIPKQFLMLGDKPVLVHTIEQFVLCNEIDKIILAVPEKWYTYSKDLIKKYFDNDKIIVIYGGKTRNDTILNICNFIKENYGLGKEDIIVTHDSVRPFITQRIILENIEMCKKADAVDTVIPAYDTIVESMDKQRISNIPVRDNMYLGQTPQTFKVETFINTYLSLTDEEKDILTDACKIFIIKNKDVRMVKGEEYNIKITVPYDMQIASFLINNKKNVK